MVELEVLGVDDAVDAPSIFSTARGGPRRAAGPRHIQIARKLVVGDGGRPSTRNVSSRFPIGTVPHRRAQPARRSAWLI